RRDLRDQPAQPAELLLRQLREVLAAEDLLWAPARGALVLARAGVRLRLRAVARLRLHAPRALDLWRARRRKLGRAQEPCGEGAVEGRDVVGPGDQRLPQRPVDVVLALEVDCVETVELIRDAPGPD